MPDSPCELWGSYAHTPRRCSRQCEHLSGAAHGASMRLDVKVALCLLLCVVYSTEAASRHAVAKRNYSDQSVRGYLTERTCWWNEVCKEEFHSKFRCRCPRWSYCRAPGRYYDAHCSITHTGYIWTQPETSASADPADK
ncbi:uncharacterized protein LOC131669102 [Phymastichus coffea]|uniref:uncharacterized protein LOC131669102 n=1 Tax=Phymastichus coffea TaxID=108790 RepID=UPI00273B24F6|nr:uncharacterized protein LOC131669102 [Phymastichus coffea]